jgi:hypothetical protein
MSETDVPSNVMPLRPLGPRRKDPTNAARSKRFRERRKRQKAVTQTVAIPEPIRTATVPIRIESENHSDFNLGATVHNGAVTLRRRTNWALVVVAYGFFALGIGINIWNASTGAITDMALPAALGVLAEAVVFFLPAWALTLPIGRQVLAWALFAFISVFALTNSLRMASIIAVDQATIRADRQTDGVRAADHALDVARTKRDEACGRGLGKTVACKVRQSEVTKLEANRAQATANVVAQSRPESSDFAKLMTWVSRGAIQPDVDDFAMLWLLFRTLLPQVGGLVLMLGTSAELRQMTGCNKVRSAPGLSLQG